jgi:hypothetical protein
VKSFELGLWNANAGAADSIEGAYDIRGNREAHGEYIGKS